MMIKIKRIYVPVASDDGFRILVDRLWPRGLSKEKARVDLWLRVIAPSDDLRKRFCHDPKKWEEFKSKYLKELESKKELLNRIKQIEKEKEIVTLLYSAKDEEHNNAVVLSAIL
jgi:uncharacterized protein YeaO (DUF488 family)